MASPTSAAPTERDLASAAEARALAKRAKAAQLPPLLTLKRPQRTKKPGRKD